MKISHNKTRGFTMIEIMVAIGVVVVLAAILIALVSGMNEKSKATSTQAKMMMLGEAVEAFKQATGRYPLCVPEDAWGASWTTFVSPNYMKWDNTKHDWEDYFVDDDTSNHNPRFSWDTATTYPTYPTNIQMLTFQLEQVPESNSILERLKQSSGQIQQMRFDSSEGENWVRADSDCRIYTPLNDTQRRIAFQPVDAWGTPLRFWTGDILPWAKRTGGGKWHDSVLQLLSDRLQKANWGFFIESAGKDGQFGWWAQPATATNAQLNAQAAEDNLYKP